MTNEKDKIPIIIDSFTGGASGKDLKECYFKYHEKKDAYDFHDKDGKEKCKDLKIGIPSPWFTLDEYPHIQWTITLTPPCNELVVNGGWHNTVPSVTEEEGGTFQGQAGGTWDDEEASAASASGY